ncbi:MAG TPA: hypothetical protein VFC07_07390 [Verrucomicrobiae bacterium]|nr:hypothetical protein [Verrucomicrobiae bacterium]
MTETAQRKRGGRAYHSILEQHFDFIRQQRQRRKTRQEISDLLFTEKGIRVTLYAPYHFYRRFLRRRTKVHWENQSEHSESQPMRPSTAVSQSQSRPSPLPQEPIFKRPDLSKFNMDHFT